jgi:hypothetical protein
MLTMLTILRFRWEGHQGVLGGVTNRVIQELELQQGGGGVCLVDIKGQELEQLAVVAIPVEAIEEDEGVCIQMVGAMLNSMTSLGVFILNLTTMEEEEAAVVVGAEVAVA